MSYKTARFIVIAIVVGKVVYICFKASLYIAHIFLFGVHLPVLHIYHRMKLQHLRAYKRRKRTSAALVKIVKRVGNKRSVGFGNKRRQNIQNLFGRFALCRQVASLQYEKSLTRRKRVSVERKHFPAKRLRSGNGVLVRRRSFRRDIEVYKRVIPVELRLEKLRVLFNRRRAGFGQNARLCHKIKNILRGYVHAVAKSLLSQNYCKRQYPHIVFFNKLFA